MVRGEIDGENLEAHLENLYTTRNVVQADRGDIYDRDGHPIATDATSYKMIAILTDKWSQGGKSYHVEDPKRVAEILAKHLPSSEDKFYDQLTLEADQVEFGNAGNNLSYHTISQIKKDLEAEKLTGITFEEKKSRLYPNGVFASHTVGIAQHPDASKASLNADDDKQNVSPHEMRLAGVMGLEASFDDVLAGVNGKYTYKHDSAGYIIPNEPLYIKEPVNGKHIHTTFDRNLQIFLESTLDQVEQVNDPENVVVALMDAKKGDMIAAAQRPSFNAATLENIDKTWQNLFVETAYEPGSTIKLLTTAAAIEEGSYQPNEYYKSGTINIHGETVSDFMPEGWGWISQLEGLSKSSNVLMVNLVEDMGLETWKNHLDHFGFGQLTGIKLPNEYTGSNPYGDAFTAVNTSFGQGITVTTVQLLQAFSALANEGVMVRPRFVTHIENNGELEEIKTEKTKTLISPESAKEALKQALAATELYGSLTSEYRREGESIIAKTGTAELINPETGLYYKDQFIFSSVAMFPAEDPEYILYIAIQQPKFGPNEYSGQQVVLKIYNAMMDRLLEMKENLENKDNDTVAQYMETPTLLDDTVSEVVSKLEESGRKFSIIGSGDQIIQQYPLPETPLYREQPIILMTDGAPTMPDINGWSKNDVLKITELTGVKFNFEGEGYVVYQEKDPGTLIQANDQINVRLSSTLPEFSESQNALESHSDDDEE